MDDEQGTAGLPEKPVSPIAGSALDPQRGWLALAGLLAGIAAFGSGEVVYKLIPAEKVTQKIMGQTVVGPTAKTTAVADIRNAALGFGLLGVCLGGTLGVAGGMARRSASAMIGAGVLGALLGLAMAGLLSFWLLPIIFETQPYHPEYELVLSMISHASIWGLTGAVAGLAFGVGFGDRRSFLSRADRRFCRHRPRVRRFRSPRRGHLSAGEHRRAHIDDLAEPPSGPADGHSRERSRCHRVASTGATRRHSTAERGLVASQALSRCGHGLVESFDVLKCSAATGILSPYQFLQTIASSQNADVRWVVSLGNWPRAGFHTGRWRGRDGKTGSQATDAVRSRFAPAPGGSGIGCASAALAGCGHLPGAQSDPFRDLFPLDAIFTASTPAGGRDDLAAFPARSPARHSPCSGMSCSSRESLPISTTSPGIEAPHQWVASLFALVDLPTNPPLSSDRR